MSIRPERLPRFDGMSAQSCNASRTFSAPFGVNGAYEQYRLADAVLAFKVGLVMIVSIDLVLASSL